ncbi:MAG: hypothetical protein JXQ76_07530 [Campylobacterales bacterium]|nr:hypothetical protein [Campylobacterales bacterium]
MVRFVSVVEIPQTQEAIEKVLDVLKINRKREALKKHFLDGHSSIAYDVYRDNYLATKLNDCNLSISYDAIIGEDLSNLEYLAFKVRLESDLFMQDFQKWQEKKSTMIGQRARVALQSIKNIVTPLKKTMTNKEREWGKRL